MIDEFVFCLCDVCDVLYRLVHDSAEFFGEISVVCLHLFVIFLLVFFDQSFINTQTQTTHLHELTVKHKNTQNL